MAEFGYLLLVLVFAGIGAWIASYVREKGKNYATQEDVQKLTRLAEEVRAEIAGKAWLDQKRWDLRRDFYWQLLGSLTETMASIRGTYGAIKEWPRDVEGFDRLLGQLGAIQEEMRRQGIEMNRLMGIARIIVPSEVISMVSNFRNQLEGLAREQKSQLAAVSESSWGADESADPETQLEQIRATWNQWSKITAGTYGKYLDEAEKVVSAVADAARRDLLVLNR